MKMDKKYEYIKKQNPHIREIMNVDEWVGQQKPYPTIMYYINGA